MQFALLGIGDTTGLVIGMLFVRGDWKEFADVVFDGMTERVAATAIVAWLWAGMFAQTIQVGAASSTASCGPPTPSAWGRRCSPR